MKKDFTEKALEAFNDVFADIVNNLLFEGEKKVLETDLAQGRERNVYLGEKGLREQERDTSKYWKDKNIRIALLGIENETEPEAAMPFRVIGYDGADYRDQIRYEKDKDGKRRLVMTTYPVITMVLYFGYKKRWDKARSLYELFGEIDEDLKKYVNDYSINLFEIAFLPDEQVDGFESDFWIVADYLRQMRKNGRYDGSRHEIRHIREVLQLMGALTRDDRYEKIAQECEKERGGQGMDMRFVLDEYVNKGIEQGRKEGRREGRKEGRREEEGRMRRLIKELDSRDRIRELVKASTDQKEMERLYKEFNIE